MDPKTLTIQYGYTTWLFNATLKDLSEATALNQPTPGGNCLNWVAGHIVQSRGGTLGVLGQDLPFPAEKYARYDRGSEPITGPDSTIPLSEMREDFAATQAGLEAGLKAITPEFLMEKAPFSPGNNEKETVGSLLAGLVFHESYHVGQLGILRRLAGEDGVVK